MVLPLMNVANSDPAAWLKGHLQCGNRLFDHTLVGLRPTADVERNGLDQSHHGEPGSILNPSRI